MENEDVSIYILSMWEKILATLIFQVSPVRSWKTSKAHAYIFGVWTSINMTQIMIFQNDLTD